VKSKELLKVDYLPTLDLIPYANNTRTHSDEQVSQICSSIKEFGFTNPVLIDEDNGLIAGHGRVMAAKKLGLNQVPTIKLTGLSDAQRKAYIIADNKLALNAGWDDELLKVELEGLKDLDFDISLTGFSDDELDELFGDDELDGDYTESNGSLSDRFGVPPFSVLNAREGWWQDRKKSWLALGIKSEEGRDIEPTNISSKAPAYMQGRGNNDGGSIFDPVLCELAYKWFTPAGGTVLDPFAGGSVRGVVASKLGYQYVGGELRGEQVTANRKQADEICSDPMPVWVEGDSAKIDNSCADVKADIVFSCPPYADLEVYSDDPADISNMAYNDFIDAYRGIIKKSTSLLKEDRFAVFVIGEVRDKKGNYYNFVGDTIKAFTDAGLRYYNEMILITPAGTLPIRAAKSFESGRKIGKTHQNVLVFVKGNGKKAAKNCGPCEFGEITDQDGNEDAQ
jgi:DNA modification methylase